MNKAAIQEALLTIATRTAEQDRKVADRLASAGERSGHPAYTDLRAASQALLTGEVARARAARREFAPWAEWGSWIEGVPFAHALLFNDGLIVDVLPCRDETEFVRIYHCSPKQFYDILLATGGSNRRVFFNLRDYDPARPETGAAYIGSPPLELVFEHFTDKEFENCYLNATRSKSLLALFDPEGLAADFEDRLGGIPARRGRAALLNQLEGCLARENRATIRAAHPRALVRGPGGEMQPPVPIQIFKRVAYHLAFSSICADIPTDDFLWVALDKTERGERMDFEAIMELCGRATQLHHEYTAPLTGAYGGTYNLTESEAETSLYEPIGREREARKEAFLEFLYAGVAGLIRPKDERLQALRRVGGALTLMQSGNAPSDGELRAYLDFLPESRQFLRKRSQLEEALRDRILAKNGSLDDVENYIEQADKAYRQVNGFWSKLGKSVFLGAGAAVGGAGCGFVAAGMGFFSTVLKTAAEKAAEVVIPKSLERFVSKRNDAKQIVRVLDTLGS